MPSFMTFHYSPPQLLSYRLTEILTHCSQLCMHCNTWTAVDAAVIVFGTLYLNLCVFCLCTSCKFVPDANNRITIHLHLLVVVYDKAKLCASLVKWYTRIDEMVSVNTFSVSNLGTSYFYLRLLVHTLTEIYSSGTHFARFSPAQFTLIVQKSGLKTVHPSIYFTHALSLFEMFTMVSLLRPWKHVSITDEKKMKCPSPPSTRRSS